MRCVGVLVSLAPFLVGSVAYSQQVTVTAPATTVSDSFSERFGVGFSINHPNFSLGFGGPSGSGMGGGGFTPPLDGLVLGIPFRGGKVNGSLSITAGQSFSRSLSTTAPIVTLSNGVPGYVFGGTVAPFVTGLIPVAGAGLPISGPPATSRVRSLLDLGEIQLQKDSGGKARLVVNEPAPRRASADPDPEPSRTNAESSNSFRQALQKYATPKR